MTGQSMTQMRIGLAQINPRVGDIEHNIALIREYVGKAQHSGVHLLLFPEMVVTGYPIEDLTHRSSLQRESVAATNHLAASLETEGFGEMAVVVGYLDQSENGKSARNCAAVIHRGQVRARYVKRHLPNYGVFDEYRNFTPGESTLLFRHCGVDVAIAICEDIWQEGAAMAEVAARNPGLVVVINGSPYERKKDDQRRDLVARRALQIGAPLCYVNMTGGQDDLVFDGDSIVVDAAGRVVARAPQFEDGLMVVDLDLIANSTTSDLVITDGPLPPYEKLVPG
ncbi:MAG: nitrilase-related carbon-nitrogen hydrolase, partial [Candidatus Nanopelagicaceae bacterium]